MLSRITHIPSLVAWPLFGLSVLVACDGGEAIQRSPLEARDNASHDGLAETVAPLAPFATLDAAGIAALSTPPEATAPVVDPAGGLPALWLSDRLERPSCKSPEPTSTVRATLRLDAHAQVSRGTFDPLAPWLTAHASVPMVVFGADSKCVGLQIYLRRIDTDLWRWWMLADGGDLRGGVYGLPTEIGVGELRFDAAGHLIAQKGGEVSTSLVGLMRPWVLHIDFTDTTLADGSSDAERVLFDGCYETGSEACL